MENLDLLFQNGEVLEDQRLNKIVDYINKLKKYNDDKMVTLSVEEYNNLKEKDPDVFYFVYEE